MIPGLFLFDLDGTLVDTAPDLGGAVNDMRIARGLEPLPLDLLREPAGHGAPKLLKAAFNMETTDEAYPAMRAEFLKNYAARGVSHSPLFAGIRELLEALREMHVPMGVVTNKPQELADRVCRELDLSDFMEVVIGLGPEGTKLKPAPDSLLLALKRTGIPAEKRSMRATTPRMRSRLRRPECPLPLSPGAASRNCLIERSMNALPGPLQTSSPGCSGGKRSRYALICCVNTPRLLCVSDHSCTTGRLQGMIRVTTSGGALVSTRILTLSGACRGAVTS